MSLFFQGIIAPALIIGAFGLLFGLCLTFAARKFAVEEDPRIEEIHALLPGADCGACGYPGCGGYANALLENPSLLGACNACSAEKEQKIAMILGITAEEKAARVVKITCQGDCINAKAKYSYEGMSSCRNALRLGGGAKACFYGCLGLGDCASVCPNDAIVLKDGLASIDQEKCLACGACITACPKGLIRYLPATAPVYLACATQEKGATAKKQCGIACIGCGLCAKACESGAIELVNNLPVFDYEKCTACGACADKCPTGALVKH